MKESNKTGIIVSLFFLIIVVMIFIPIISGTLSEQSKIDKEQQLLESLETIPAEQIIKEITELLSKRDETQLKSYIDKEFTYIDNTNHTSNYIDGFWRDLKYLVTNYDIEHRANSIDGQETYFIYWNTNEKAEGRADQFYCLQKINIKLVKTIEQDKVTYKIRQIILTNNLT